MNNHVSRSEHLDISKSFLVLCLAFYIASIFLVDYFGDSLAFQIREAAENFFNRDKGFHVVKRFFLWDVAVEIGFFTIVCTAFARYPRSFFFFNGFDSPGRESSNLLFLKVLRNCFLTSLVLIILLGIIQGFLFWMPKYAVGIYLELTHPELGLQGHKQPQYEYLGHGLKLINFSLIFVALIRIRIFTTLAHSIFFAGKRSKPIHSFIIFFATFLLIFCAARFSQPQKYQLVEEIKSQDAETSTDVILFQKKEDRAGAESADDRIITEEESKLIQEAPRAHITVHDNSTGETTTNY